MNPDQTPAAIFVAVLAIVCAVAWLAAGVATFVWLWRARGNADPADVRLVSGRWFPTWREAFDYADAMARSDS